METAKRLQDSRQHATVECIPVPPKVASKAPLYFKKSIDDAEDEWSQHHAKRWIDTSAKVRALRQVYDLGYAASQSPSSKVRVCIDRPP